MRPVAKRPRQAGKMPALPVCKRPHRVGRPGFQPGLKGQTNSLEFINEFLNQHTGIPGEKMG